MFISCILNLLYSIYLFFFFFQAEDGIQNPTWEQVDPKVMLNPDQPLEITFQRGTKQFERTIVPEAAGTSQMRYVGWVADQPNTVTDLEPGMPAEKAGVTQLDIMAGLD